MAMFEFIYLGTAALFTGLVTLGHLLLTIAIYRCLSDDLPADIRRRLPADKGGALPIESY
jgi:hypothetical protein